MPDIITKAAAKALGLKRYFTGKPCKRGHMSDRSVSTSNCLKCAGERLHQYNEANRDEIRERKRQYYEANRDKRLEYGRRYYRANRDKRREYDRRYREANRDKCLERTIGARATEEGVSSTRAKS